MTSDAQGSILLVDHSRGALLFQETILRRRDMQVMTALAGSEGLVKARMEKPNLIIFGYDLFDMTAPEFCREIRADELTRAISLLLVCDRDHAEHGDLCLSAGCNDVIFRPLQKPELDQKVEKLTRIPVRRQLRTITKIEVSLEKNGRFVLGRSVNISATGILIEVDRMLPQEGPVRLHFYLPGDAQPLQLLAEVLRAEFSGSMSKYGMRFLDPSEDERARISRFVHRLRSRETI
ncbi:MAG: PilZ domain-containing protein [Acidobacteria bacterium]|nr:PilZ domain-containing protein [Acidobacteriota bacterium]MBV9474807.1 PilZ domain-containing protein [Acidobacteriota bacterium]